MKISKIFELPPPSCFFFAVRSVEFLHHRPIAMSKPPSDFNSSSGVAFRFRSETSSLRWKTRRSRGVFRSRKTNNQQPTTNQPTNNNNNQQQQKRYPKLWTWESISIPKNVRRSTEKQTKSLGLSTHCLAVCMTSAALPIDVSTQPQDLKGFAFFQTIEELTKQDVCLEKNTFQLQSLCRFFYSFRHIYFKFRLNGCSGWKTSRLGVQNLRMSVFRALHHKSPGSSAVAGAVILLVVWWIRIFNPWGSMYGIFTYISHKNQPNVGKYTIHGSSGNESWVKTHDFSSFSSHGEW